MDQVSSYPALRSLNQSQLESWLDQARTEKAVGTLPGYIPKLAEVDPNQFAVQICHVDGTIQAYGDRSIQIPFMSAVKPFVLLYLLEQLGAASVFALVGTQFSDLPYNSIAQLELDRYKPRNPMINSGAIVLADQLPGGTATDRCQNLCEWLNQKAESHWQLDSVMLASVQSRPNPTNQAIGHLLGQAGHLQNVEMALDTYQQVCCLSGTVADLAQSGLLLAKANPTIAASHQRIVNALMLTCGLYDASGKYAVEIGLPIKSSVSGLLLAIVPKQGAIACYSPLLDQSGNSIVGIRLLQQIAQTLNLSLFN